MHGSSSGQPAAREGFSPRIVAAILRKDWLCLYPLILLAITVFGGDVLIMKLELLPLWMSLRMPLALLASTVLILALFQLDSPVSLVEDWLCRPVPRRELLAAKLLVVFGALYGSRVLATLVADLLLGYPPGEALRDAVLLQDQFFLLLLPILLMTAAVTSTLVQGIGTLVALFVAVFVIPSAFVRPPGPLWPAIGDALGSNGMGWMTMVPAKLVLPLLVALCFWLVYWRRRVLAARVLVPASTALMLLLVLLPMWVVPWDTLQSLQAATVPGSQTADVAVLDRLRLRNLRSCFPATRIGALNSDTAFTAARQFNGLRQWTDEDLRDSGPDAIAFLTQVEPRGLPQDWRVKILHAQADYQGGGTAVSLRPASFITDGKYGTSLSHAWVMPEQTLKSLVQVGGPDIALRYSLAVLNPRSASLPTDGRRHRVPGVGYCSARIEALQNQVLVECFRTSLRLAQLSAELAGIEPTRVYGDADFSPRWLRWPRGQRLELSIGSPRLSAQDHVTVTAWELVGIVDRNWSGSGILGDDAETCPLPGADGGRPVPSLWSDSAPHEVRYLTVDEGVQLEILDFGGSGTPLLLLPGLGATAHSFDALAPQLARDHRVIAMTRRGSGASSHVDFGYDTPRLADDVIAVMDGLGLQKAVLVGASIAGDELTWLGGHDAERLLGLVYLDAAYDRSSDDTPPRLRELQDTLPPEPPSRPQDMRNYTAFLEWQRRRGGLPLPEGELIAFYNANQPYLAGAPNMDLRVAGAIEEAIGRPDYASVSVPALALYATGDGEPRLRPWYDPTDPTLLPKLREIGEIVEAMRRRNIDRFRAEVSGGRAVELAGAQHAIWLSNEADVLREIRAFVAGLAVDWSPM